jgi:Cytochrome P450
MGCVPSLSSLLLLLSNISLQLRQQICRQPAQAGCEASPGYDPVSYQRRINSGRADSGSLPRDVRSPSRLQVPALTVRTSIAGTDSTATAFRMTMLYLLSTPSAFAFLKKEVDDGIAAGTISAPVAYAEAQSMPYLQACIREGLRLYPPSTGMIFKEVPKGGDTVHGYYLPEGTQLGSNICGITRSEEIFGVDSRIFRPERWLEADEEQFKKMLSATDLVFGYGKFQCMGRTIAYVELSKVIVEVSSPFEVWPRTDLTGIQVIRRYDIATVKPQQPLRLWDAGFCLAHDFWIRISRRTDVK